MIFVRGIDSLIPQLCDNLLISEQLKIIFCKLKYGKNGMAVSCSRDKVQNDAFLLSFYTKLSEMLAYIN